MKQLRATSQEVIERRKKEALYMKEHPHEIVSMVKLGEIIGISKSTVRADLEFVAKDIGGTIEFVPRKGAVWHPTKKMEYENHEGYSDPTAAVALKNVEDTVSRSNFFDAGEVHAARCFDGSYIPAMVVKDLGSRTMLLPLTPCKNGPIVDSRGTAKYSYVLEDIVIKPKKYVQELLFKVQVNEGPLHDDLREFFDILGTEDETLTAEVTRLKAEVKSLRVERTSAANDKNAVIKANTSLTSEINKLKAENDRLRLENEAIKTNDNVVENVQLKEELEKKNQQIASYILAGDGIDDGDHKATDNLEVALLKQKVEIYERLIFGEATK